MAGVDDAVLRELHRAATLQERAGISIVSKDAPRADRITGSRERTKQAIERLTKDRRAVRVRRDLLALADSTGLMSATLHELVDVIAPHPYLITGGRALVYHGLTDQHFFELVALVPVPAAGFSWRREQVRYLTTAHERIWGGRPARALGEHRPRPLFASVERAVVDAIDHPRYGVSMTQAVQALRDALRRDKRLAGRLVRATDRYGSAATARRVGFLVDRVAGPAAAAPFARMIGASRTPVLLRASTTDDGPVDLDWHVRVNVDLELILEEAR
jgi:predicted transcriptional regulator of viral defense system